MANLITVKMAKTHTGADQSMRLLNGSSAL